MPFKKLSEKLARARSMDNDYLLKQRLFEALKQSVSNPVAPAVLADEEPVLALDLERDRQLDDGRPVYSILQDAAEAEEPESEEPPLTPELAESAYRLKSQLDTLFPAKVRANSGFSAKLSNTTEGEDTGLSAKAGADLSEKSPSDSEEFNTISLTDTDHDQTGGSMTDLTGYKDLSKAPLSYGDDADEPVSTFSVPQREERAATATLSPGFGDIDGDVDTEFSGNVKTLIRLVNELPEDVTKQTGAQIIRLTMEAMGISMEDVLSEAQSAQSEMLDAVRANIKKIEEYKTVIRKLETDIKYYQGKANELSEIIDLFILSNSSGPSDD